MPVYPTVLSKGEALVVGTISLCLSLLAVVASAEKAPLNARISSLSPSDANTSKRSNLVVIACQKYVFKNMCRK